MRAFLKEVRRRRVFRTAALYIVGAWLVMQAADVLFPAWGVPETAKNILLVATVAGLPVALIFGWLFDVGVDGISRAKPAGADALDASYPLRRNDYLILTALIGTRLGLAPAWALLASALLGLASPLLAYTKSLYPATGVGLFLALALWAALGGFWIGAGVAVGAAMACRGPPSRSPA